MKDNSSAEKICQQIREDSQKEAETIIQKAKRNAGLRIKLAQGEAKRYVKEHNLKVAGQIEQIEQKVLAGVNLEIRKIILQAREKIIDSVLQAIRKKGAEFRQQQEYENWLNKVIIEGIRNIGDKNITVIISRQDAALVPKIENNIKEALTVTVVTDENVHDTGAIIKSADGRKVFYNIFSARLERLMPKLRLLIVKEIFGEEK